MSGRKRRVLDANSFLRAELSLTCKRGDSHPRRLPTLGPQAIEFAPGLK
jgi:hypothetical protein